MENKHHISDDAVTISETLKALGNQAPSRQSLYTAIKRGKIRDLTDKENPKAKRMVSWKSVLAYIADGGFKSRKRSGAIDEGQSKTAPSMAKQDATDSPPETVTAATVPPRSSTTAMPPESQTENVAGNTSTKREVAPRGEQSPRPSRGKRDPTPPRERANPKPDKKTASGENSKGRRTLPLRTIKNNLRHLDYEQTKAIRDWADNRLLTVLRPESPVVSDGSENETPQPA